MSCVIVGIDPGIKGALAVMRDGEIADTIVMPTVKDDGKTTVDSRVTHGYLKTWVMDAVSHGRKVLVVLEVVHAMPKQGVTSMFSFGRSYGRIEAVIDILCLPVEKVTPKRWQKAILEGGAKTKDDTIAYVMRRFPGVNLIPPRCKKPHDGISDAIAMAEFGRRLLEGK